MQINENTRKFRGYLLDEYEGNTFQTHNKYPCELCELEDVCDRIEDDLNKIEYFLCKEVNHKFKEDYPYAFFRNKNK